MQCPPKLKVHVYVTLFFFVEQSAVLIESSTQTNPKDRKAEDDTTKMKDAKTEWSEEEKRRLLDALKKYCFVV